MLFNIKYYKYKKNVGVVDAKFLGDYSLLKIDKFYMEDAEYPPGDWHTPYMPQYYHHENYQKLRKTNETQHEKIFRVVFFIFFLREGQNLVTPYGTYIVRKLTDLPDVLKLLTSKKLAQKAYF